MLLVDQHAGLCNSTFTVLIVLAVPVPPMAIRLPSQVRMCLQLQYMHTVWPCTACSWDKRCGNSMPLMAAFCCSKD